MLPYNLLNYAYGLSGVALRPYIIGTWLGMLPAVGLYVYLGSIARSLGELFDRGADIGVAGQLMMLAGLGLAIAAVWLVHRTATRLLGEHMPDESS